MVRLKKTRHPIWRLGADIKSSTYNIVKALMKQILARCVIFPVLQRLRCENSAHDPEIKLFCICEKKKELKLTVIKKKKKSIRDAALCST